MACCPLWQSVENNWFDTFSLVQYTEDDRFTGHLAWAICPPGQWLWQLADWLATFTHCLISCCLPLTMVFSFTNTLWISRHKFVLRVARVKNYLKNPSLPPPSHTLCLPDQELNIINVNNITNFQGLIMESTGNANFSFLGVKLFNLKS